MTATKFGRYDLLERVGTSQVADIYKARSLGAAGFEKIVAIKRIKPSLEKNNDFVKLFTEEARISASLTHANIAQVFEFGRIGEAHYLAMEYLSGTDLSKILKQFSGAGKPMPLPLALHIAHAVASGLAYAHSRANGAGRPLDILHLGVNPKNILVSHEGAVKLTDFGIGRARASLPGAERQRGTHLGYMSPEQLAQQAVDPRSDIFSLGCVLYECAVGRAAFHAADEKTTEKRIRQGQLAPPAEANPDLPKQAQEIISRALAHTPDDRHESAAELGRAIEAFAFEARLTFNAKQLARWMQSNVSKPAGAHKAARASERQRRPSSRLGATRPGAATPVMIRGPGRRLATGGPSSGAGAHSLLRARSDSSDSIARPRPALSKAAGRRANQSGEAARPRQDMARTRMGLGSPLAAEAVRAPGSAEQRAQKEPSPPESYGTSEPTGTVNLTDADLLEAQVDALSGERSDDDSVDLMETLPVEQANDARRHEPAAAAAAGASATADARAPALSAEQLQREAEALAWDDGPTILDPRKEESFEENAREADRRLGSGFVVAEERLDVRTGVEPASASLLGKTLVDSDAGPAKGDSDALPHERKGDEEPPLPTTLDMEPEDLPAGQGAEQDEAAAADQPATAEPAVAQPVSAKPAADPSRGLGILLPTLAIISAILLIAGAVLLYVLITQTGETAIQPPVATAPSAEDDESLTTRSLEETPEPKKPGATEQARKPETVRPKTTEQQSKQTAAVKVDARPEDAATTVDDKPQKAASDAGTAQPKAAPTTQSRDRGKLASPRKKRRKLPEHRSRATATKQPPKQTAPARVVEPEESRGYLIVASRPKAKVLVDGWKTGRETPIRPNEPLALSPGTHRITLVAKGRRFHYTVTVKARQTIRLVRVLPLP